jgi:Fe2+ transport system protein FeoA
MKFEQLKTGQIAQISGVNSGDEIIDAKLREIGFAEGDEVEIMHFGPFGRTPICVRLNRTLIALRPEEAKALEIIIP